MSTELLKLILGMDGIKAAPIPMISEIGRKNFLVELLRRIETARSRSEWTDIEVAIAVNLAEKDVGLALMRLISGGEDFVKTHAYSFVDVASRKLARNMLGIDVGILAKMQKNGEWTVKLTWAGGEILCESSHKFNISQAIVWCVISAMIVEVNKDGSEA